MGTPQGGLFGEAPHERGTVFRLQVYEGLGNQSSWSVKRPDGITDACYGSEKLARKRSGPSCSEGGKAIRWINIYQLRSATGFPNTYLLDSDLSAG